MKALLAVCLLAASALALAQPAAEPQQPPLPESIAKHKEIYLNLGFPEDEATMMAVLTGGKVNSEAMMMLMMGMGEGGGGGDAFGFMMLMNGMKGASQTQAPWWRDGEFLFVVEDGVLVKINTRFMQVEGRLPYREDAELEAVSLGLLARMFKGRGDIVGPEQQTACLSNMKQLMLGLLMYTQDFDGNLPGATWAKDLMPYLKNEQVFKCPDRPDAPVAYALNEKLIGANLEDIKRPSEIVALFEVIGGAESPVGNAADVPDPGFHDGMLTVGFMDGHAKLMSSLALRQALEQNPFE